MQEHEPLFAPKVRGYVYHELQELAHNLMTNQLMKVSDLEGATRACFVLFGLMV